MPTYATHEIDGVNLDIILDQHYDGTWTASWFYPHPMEAMDWADGSGHGFVSQEAAEEAAIQWAREHGPQRAA